MMLTPLYTMVRLTILKYGSKHMIPSKIKSISLLRDRDSITITVELPTFKFGQILTRSEIGVDHLDEILPCVELDDRHNMFFDLNELELQALMMEFEL